MPPATEGWPNPPKNWFIRIVGLPLGEHTLKVTCKDPNLGCISIDALGTPIPVGGYVKPLEPSDQIKIQASLLISIGLVGLVGAISTLFAIKGKCKA